MKIVTFNIRSCYDGWDEKQSFIFRAGLVREVIAREKPDVVAFQEVTEQISELLKTILPEYLIVGHGRLQNYDGEGLYTAILKESVDLIGLETFWLSPTPYIPSSRYEEQSQCPRVCCCTLIRDKKSGQLLYVYYIHLDHIKTTAQEKQLRLVVDKMKARCYDYPAVLLGDFNLKHSESEEMEWLRQQDIVPLRQISGLYPVTYHGFGEYSEDYLIDYIFTTEDIADKAGKVCLWQDEKHGIYLSDHYPICAEFEF